MAKMMSQKIFLIYGMLAFSVAKQLRSDRDEDEEIQNFIKHLQFNGNIGHKSHHNDKHDDHKGLNINSLNWYLKHNNFKEDKLLKNDLTVNDDDEHKSHTSEEKHTVGNDNTESDGYKFFNLFKARDPNSLKFEGDYEQEAENDIDLVLNDLKKRLEDANPKLRCRGNRCGKNRDDDGDDRNENLRCRGNRCGKNRDDDDDDNNRKNYHRNENLRCRGNRCGKHRDDDDDDNNRIVKDRNENLRCRGNRCEKNRDDDEDDNNRMDNDRNEKLRCRGNQCGKNRDDDDDDNNRMDNDRNEKLRCRGNRCENNREGDYDISNKIDRNENMRCKGNRCSWGRSNEDAGLNQKILSLLQHYGKRYKINEDLDAIMLDFNNFDGIQLNKNLKRMKLRDSKNNSLLKHKTERKRKHHLIWKEKPQHRNSLENTETKFKSNDKLTLPELAEQINKYNKRIYNLAYLYVINPSMKMEELRRQADLLLGDERILKDIRNFYMGQKNKKKIRPRIVEMIKQNVGLYRIEVVAGKDMQKVFIPPWLLEKIQRGRKPPKRFKPPQSQRSLLPMTLKQKVKRQMMLKANRELASVPFVLTVQGLGQVNP